MLAKTFGGMSGLGNLLMRIAVGLAFVFAGIGKLMGLAGTTGYFGSLGIPLPGVMAPVIAIVELVGGLAIMFGLLTRPAALLLAINMLVATLLAKLGGAQGLLAQGLPAGWNAVRLELVLLACCLWFLFNGAGKSSIEHDVLKKELI